MFSLVPVADQAETFHHCVGNFWHHL